MEHKEEYLEFHVIKEGLTLEQCLICTVKHNADGSREFNIPGLVDIADLLDDPNWTDDNSFD